MRKRKSGIERLGRGQGRTYEGEDRRSADPQLEFANEICFMQGHGQNICGTVNFGPLISIQQPFPFFAPTFGHYMPLYAPVSAYAVF